MSHHKRQHSSHSSSSQLQMLWNNVFQNKTNYNLETCHFAFFSWVIWVGSISCSAYVSSYVIGGRRSATGWRFRGSEFKFRLCFWICIYIYIYIYIFHLSALKSSNHPQRKPHIILSTKFVFLFGYLSGIIRQYFMTRVFFLDVCICSIHRSSAILQNFNFL